MWSEQILAVVLLRDNVARSPELQARVDGSRLSLWGARFLLVFAAVVALLGLAGLATWHLAWLIVAVVGLTLNTLEVKLGRSARTVRAFESRVLMVRAATTALSGPILLMLKRADVQRFLNGLTEAGHAARHVAHVKGVLRSAVGQAMRMELVDRNVGALASVPPQHRPEFAVLSAEQVRELLGALEGHRLRALFTTGALLGLRRGELICLKWSDVDLDARTLNVRRTGPRIGGRVHRRSTEVGSLPQDDHDPKHIGG